MTSNTGRFDLGYQYTSTKAVRCRPSGIARSVGSFMLPAFLLGCALNSISYFSMQPMILGVAFWGFGAIVIRFFYSSRSHEFLIFSTTFAICWFMSGVVAIYSQVLTDGERLDTIRFYYFSVGLNYRDLDLDTLKTITEGSLAVLIWRQIYDFVAFLGFTKGVYVGILANNFAVSITGILAVRIARRIYGNDQERLNRLVLLFSCCCLFWLFAAFHLRDVFVLLAVTVLVLFWIKFLESQTIRNLVALLVVSFTFSSFMVYLRTEFAFVPAVFLVAGSVAVALYSRIRSRQQGLVYVIAVGGMLAGTIFLPFLIADVSQLVFNQNDNYNTLSSNLAASNSLGMAIVVNQPLPIRFVLGTLLLYIFPIPVWSGFQIEDAYKLFKSLHAIFNYFFVPLLILSIYQLIAKKQFRKPSLLFLLFTVVGFTFAIASTSMENRHLGVFMVPMLLLALLPDLTRETIWGTYRILLQLFIVCVVFIHIAWIGLKIF